MKPYDNYTFLLLSDEERLEEWNEIEELVIQYQTYFNDPIDSHKSKEAADILLQRFSPLFKSYITLIKYNQIDWNSKEQKTFIYQFIEDRSLKRALNRKKTSAEFKAKIYHAFNFVKSTYGELSEEDILADLYVCFLTLMKRYKQKGKNFCAYVANSYHFEVARYIKKQISNPLVVNYKNCQYEDVINGENSNEYDVVIEDNYYESMMGLPDYTWVNGDTCSSLFSDFTPYQRKILIKYYLEDYNDRQISELFGTNIGVINSKRRNAVDRLCDLIGVDKDKLPRKRKSGRKANLPVNNKK